MEGIQGWVDDFNRKPPTMWVMDPETVQGSGWMSKSVTTYLVQVTNNEIAFSANGIRKRYSEFEQLKSILDARYGSEGLLVPPLPPKNSMSTQDEGFLKSRAVGLSLFMENLAKSPFLVKDITVEKFLMRGLDQSDSDGINTSNSPKDSTDNIGYSKWLQYVDSFPECHEGDMKINNLRHELEALSRQLRDMMEKFKLYTQGVTLFQKNTKNISAAFSGWRDAELATTSLNEINPVPSYTTSDMTGSLSTLVDSMSLPSATVSQLDVSVYERIHYELNFISEINALLKKREAVFNTIYNHQSKIQKILSMKENKQKEKAAELEAEKLQMQRYQDQHDRITKAIVWISLPLAARSRNENIAKACNNFAAIMTSINYRALNSCFDYHNVVNEVPSTSINFLNEGLCKLSIDPAVSVIESKYSAGSTDQVFHNDESVDRSNPLDSINVSGAGKVRTDISEDNTGIDYQSSILFSAALDNKDAIVETVVENKDLITVDNVKTASTFVNTLNQNQNDPFSAFP